MIKDALRPIRFYNGRGYYFIVSLNGVEELYPIMPELEGKNLLSLRDDKGNYVIKEEINIAKTKQEGFITDFWAKPGATNKMIFSKTSFIKLFRPLNIYVGSGEYLDNIENEIKTEIKAKIKKIRFGKEGYVFVNTYEGIAEVIDSDKHKEGDNIWDLTDPSGIKITQEQLKVIKESNGGYIHYSWKKLSSKQIAKKVSYIKGVEDWKWMIGAGLYLDEIEQTINKERSRLYNDLFITLVIIVLVLISIISIVSFTARKISLRLNRDFMRFAEDLSEAVIKGTTLKDEDYKLYELKKLSISINRIIEVKLQTENLLRNNELMFRTIFENVPVMIVILDRQLYYKRLNKEFHRFFDFDLKSSANQAPIDKLLTQSPINTNFKDLLNTLDGRFREIQLYTKEGIRSQNWAIFKTENYETIFVGYDITEIKDNQQKLKELNATKDKLFSIISHDLRSPFTSFIGLTELMTSPDSNLSLEEIKGLSVNLNQLAISSFNLLENLLEWSKLQRGMLVTDIKTNNVWSTAQHSVDTLSEAINKKEIIVINNIDKSLYCEYDHKIISTVIRNLVSNAIKFTQKNGQILIDSWVSDGKTIFTIKDSGIGIPEKILPELFTVNDIKSRPGTDGEISSGLGLIICKEFIELHNGQIWVKSKEGEGSTFFFAIPAV